MIWESSDDILLEYFFMNGKLVIMNEWKHLLKQNSDNDAALKIRAAFLQISDIILTNVKLNLNYIFKVKVNCNR